MINKHKTSKARAKILNANQGLPWSTIGLVVLAAVLAVMTSTVRAQTASGGVTALISQTYKQNAQHTRVDKPTVLAQRGERRARSGRRGGNRSGMRSRSHRGSYQRSRAHRAHRRSVRRDRRIERRSVRRDRRLHRRAMRRDRRVQRRHMRQDRRSFRRYQRRYAPRRHHRRYYGHRYRRDHRHSRWIWYAGVIPALAAILYYRDGSPVYYCRTTYRGYIYYGETYRGLCYIDTYWGRRGMRHYHIMSDY